ncbi:hypothetical protein ANN_17874, partial [Periplaneta americana]
FAPDELIDRPLETDISETTAGSDLTNSAVSASSVAEETVNAHSESTTSVMSASSEIDEIFNKSITLINIVFIWLFNDAVSTTRLFSVDEIGDSEMIFGEMRPRIRHTVLQPGESLGGMRRSWVKLRMHVDVIRSRKCSDKSREIAYKSLFRPVMEYGAACLDPYRLEHIKTLENIKKRALKRCRNNSPLKWDTLTDRRTRIRLCAMVKTYRGSLPGEKEK